MNSLYFEVKILKRRRNETRCGQKSTFGAVFVTTEHSVDVSLNWMCYGWFWDKMRSKVKGQGHESRPQHKLTWS